MSFETLQFFITTIVKKFICIVCKHTVATMLTFVIAHWYSTDDSEVCWASKSYSAC